MAGTWISVYLVFMDLVIYLKIKCVAPYYKYIWYFIRMNRINLDLILHTSFACISVFLDLFVIYLIIAFAVFKYLKYVRKNSFDNLRYYTFVGLCLDISIFGIFGFCNIFIIQICCLI